METRAYITYETDDLLRVTVHENCGLYSDGAAVAGASWTYPFVDDGKDHLFGAQPEQVFIGADRVLAEHGWTREEPWGVGDVVTGTYASITRA